MWKRGHFAFEYKGKNKDLDAAYDQLLLYRNSLENPPLLVACDIQRTIIHTNFTGTVEKVHELRLEDFARPEKLDMLRWVFHDPDKLKPTVTRETITNRVAGQLARIALNMRTRGILASAVAHFLNRLVFCMYAEDVGLLPADLFSRTLDASEHDGKKFAGFLGKLFGAMAEGGDFGFEPVRHFNGNLFDNAAVVQPTSEEMFWIKEAAKLDWSQVDPSIFGTLFERGLDPDKRSQLGAHYTSREDIETLIDPVIIKPLRREWIEVRDKAESLIAGSTAGSKPSRSRPKGGKKAPTTAEGLVRDYLQRLQGVTVLDPSCGSGNFLYIALQKLKDLEQEVINFADDKGLGGFLPLVNPRQLLGIEVNPYAFELAQMTIWIGFIQWHRANGYHFSRDPVLDKLETFRNMDAIMDRTDPTNPKEPDWPEAEFIIGNPPFLGGKRLRDGLGDGYVDDVFKVWRKVVRPEADLCCYWFEKARAQIESGKTRRAGLLSTQSIRGGANRETLNRIKQTGDIFFGIGDRNWILDGAAVHVSMVGFDNGVETARELDGLAVARINSDLSATDADVTTSRRLAANLGIAYMGDTKGGAFDIDETQALAFLVAPNPHGKPNSDVVVPWINGLDLTRRLRNFWLIDFGVSMTLDDASCYEKPFEYLRQHVLPDRESNKRAAYRNRWWLHVEARPAMRRDLEPLTRFLCTARVSKHRLFVWIVGPTLPDSQVFAFARSDDYFLGLVHSRLHEVWARSRGTQVRERESGFRYTPTTCFETFPFPEPDEAQRVAIAEAARDLDALRTRWLNPPEWTREDILEFPGTVDGPWSRYVHDPDPQGVGTVRYPILRPKSLRDSKELATRTLTNLYNKPPAWLESAHRKLDAAVCAAYGWQASPTDDDILSRLLALNLDRRAAGAAPGEFESEEAE